MPVKAYIIDDPGVAFWSMAHPANEGLAESWQELRNEAIEEVMYETNGWTRGFGLAVLKREGEKVCFDNTLVTRPWPH
jgi:hypothetical protein